MNPMQLIQMMNTNPEQAIMNMVGNNPLLSNLIPLAKSGNSKKIEEIGRNMFKEQGRDFDKEWEEFQKQFNIKH